MQQTSDIARVHRQDHGGQAQKLQSAGQRLPGEDGRQGQGHAQQQHAPEGQGSLQRPATGIQRLGRH